MTPPADSTYDVRVWSIHTYKGARRTTYIVKWSVAGKKLQRTFSTIKLAESFRAGLMVAAREGMPFDLSSGLPTTMAVQEPATAWLDHARSYATAKWPMASPRHRRGISEALTDITLALATSGVSRPNESQLRQALYRWVFNAAMSQEPLPAEYDAHLQWLGRHSPSLTEASEPARLRKVLERLALRQDGAPAAPATFARKRATLHSVLEYGVELGHFDTNPLKRVKWTAPKATSTVDRRVVVNPQQARALLEAAWDRDPALAAFFACMYYAGLRPGEARNLRVEDCTLPEEGWGRLLLTGSHQTSGAAWTNDARRGEDRGLKHRGKSDTRAIPAHPDLVASLRRHLEAFTPGVGGRLFVTRVGRAGVPVAPPYSNPVAMGTVYRAWHRAREAALTPEQCASTLARRPYDLRHACVSTWLNAGVPPARAAEWAGHSVDVLLKVYAKCVDGDDEVALTRIENALGGTGVSP